MELMLAFIFFLFIIQIGINVALFCLYLGVVNELKS